ncbi:MAG TPA: hypothetical protein PK122_03140 [Candidatus Paceibacterota bacterium]|nr:hypothetical protein [Candidatus Paceibacterota bacterium]
MSFQSDLRTLMTADSSLNAAVGNRIFFENLEENYDLTKDWIVYTIKKANQVDCMDSKNAYLTYTVYVRIFSRSTASLNSIGDYLQDYLNHKEQGDIHDIWFTSDVHTIDLEKNQYSILQEYTAIYV